MIYDEIEKLISDVLINEYELSEDQILTEFEVPNEDINFFCRFVWTYGLTLEINNQDIREIAILNLEVYERKDNDEGKILDFIREIKYSISKYFSIIYTTLNVYAKLNQIYILKNTNNDGWNSFTIGIRFYIYKER